MHRNLRFQFQTPNASLDRDTGDIYRFPQANQLHQAMMNILERNDDRSWAKLDAALAESTVSTLLNANAEGYHCLHDAVRLPQNYYCESLGKQGENPEKRNQMAEGLFRKIMNAAQGKLKSGELAVKLMTAQDDHKRSPLHYLFGMGTKNMLIKFLDTLREARCTTMTQEDYTQFICHRIDTGFTYLIYAVNARNVEMLSLFLKELNQAILAGYLRPLDLMKMVLATTTPAGLNVLHYATNSGNPEIVTALWEWLEALFAKTHPDVLRGLLMPLNKAPVSPPECTGEGKHSRSINQYLQQCRITFNCEPLSRLSDNRKKSRKRERHVEDDRKVRDKKATFFDAVIELSPENLLKYCMESNPKYVREIISRHPEYMFVKQSVVINHEEYYLSPLQWSLRCVDRKIVSILEEAAVGFELQFLMQAEETEDLNIELLAEAYRHMDDKWIQFQRGKIDLASLRNHFVTNVGGALKMVAPQHLLRVLCASYAYAEKYWHADSLFELDPLDFGDSFGTIQLHNVTYRNQNNYHQLVREKLGENLCYTRDRERQLQTDAIHYDGTDWEISERYLAVCKMEINQTIERISKRALETMVRHVNDFSQLRRTQSCFI